MDVWLVWIPGRDSPKRMHDSLDSAINEAKRLKTSTDKEVYVFAPVHVIPGRKLLRLKKNGISAANKNPVMEPRKV